MRLFLFIFMFVLGGVFPLFSGEFSPPPMEEKQEDGSFIFRQRHMGTLFTITIYPPDSMKEEQLKGIVQNCWDALNELEKTCSFFDAESELSALNKTPAGTPFQASASLFSVIEQAYEVAQLSTGYYDPTLGACSRLWKRAQARKKLPAEEDLLKAKNTVGYKKLILNKKDKHITKENAGTLIDLGGIAKGYSLDVISGILKNKKITRYRISNTSDFLVGDPPPGKKSWAIKVTRDGKVCELVNAAVSTSGTTKQFVLIDGKYYSHLINPETGLGYTYSTEAAVIARSAAWADACATAMVFLGNTGDPESWAEKLKVKLAHFSSNHK